MIRRSAASPPWWFVKFGNTLFMGYLIMAIVWLILIETVFNGGFNEAMRSLWLPWLLIVSVFAIRHRYWLYMRLGRRWWKVWAMSAVTGAMLLFMSWPYFLAANALASTESKAYAGSLIDKWISRGRSGSSHLLVFRDSSSRQKITVEVRALVYEAASSGDTVRCEYKAGLFGIPYRWRYGENKPACGLEQRQ